MDVHQEDTNPLTEHGFSPGTPAFMSPEQVKGAPLTRQSDLFSMGTVLYLAATGENPFQGENASTTCQAVADGHFHDAAQVRTGLPADIADVIRKLLAKDIRKRYATAAQVLADSRSRATCISKSRKLAGPMAPVGT